MLEALSQLNLIDEAQLAQELQSIQDTLVSISHHHRTILAKAITLLRMNIRIQEQLRRKQIFFQQWSLLVKSAKLTKSIVINRFFTRQKDRLRLKQAKYLRKNQIEEAENLYERKLKKRLFGEWALATKMDKKVLQCSLLVIRNRWNQLKMVIQCLRSDKFTKQISLSINHQKILRRSFHSWKIANKMGRIEEARKIKTFPVFLQALSQFNRLQKQKVQAHYRSFQLKMCWQQLKYNWKTNKAKKHSEKILHKKYFKTWEKQIQFLFYEKQEQIKNDEILLSYLNRKKQIKLMYFFNRWAKFVEDKKSEQHKNTIAKQYGLVKEKQSILRKFFQAWKSLKSFNLATNFREIKLKEKVWGGFQQNFMKSAKKWEQLYQFVQRREKKKYFMAIVDFNKNQAFKIKLHLLKKAFNRFGKAVVRSYVENQRKSKLYHTRTLMFKTIYALKMEADLRRKHKRTVIYIHCNMSLQRWIKRHRIRQFVESRHFLIMGKVFLELKLNRMNKEWTGRKPRNHTQEEEQSLSLQKISLESPQKMFSLEYSISNYNSNNIFEF